MPRTTDQRDLSVDDAVALPPSILRDVLIAAFDVEALAVSQGMPDGYAVLTHYLWAPHPEPRVLPTQMLVPGITGQPLHTTLDAMATQLGTRVEQWKEMIQPDVEDATLLGLGLVHETWVLPEDDAGHAADGTASRDFGGRDPGDVPGALTVLQIKGVTVNRAGFTLYRLPGREPLARLELVADSTGSSPDPSTDDGARVDRQQDLLQQAIKRNVELFHAIYAHNASESPNRPTYTPSTYTPPHRDNHTSHDGFRSGLHRSKRTPQPAGALDVALRGLTVREVERLPASDLQDVALYAIQLEAKQPACDPANPSCLVIQHHAQHDDTIGHGLIHVDDGLATCSNLNHLADAIVRDENIEALVSSTDSYRYLGVSIITDFIPFIDSVPSLSRTVDHFRSGATRMIAGTCHDGSCYLIHVDHNGTIDISLFPNHATAVVALGDRVTRALATINEAFAAWAANTRLVAPAGTEPAAGYADLATLPPPLLTGSQRNLLLRAPRHPSDPRAGAVYVPVPANDPRAARLCFCGQQLANGEPVQTFAIAPIDMAARRAALAGNVHESVILLGHHQCVLKLDSDPVAALSSLFGTWGLIR